MKSPIVIMRRDRLEQLVQQRAEELTRQINRGYEMELLMKQTDIATLQNQINPHFLYNTLECIRGQAMKEGAADIAEITQALSRFFRYSISKQKNVVTLADELANVKGYTLIQQYRFQERFTLQVDIPPDSDLLNCLIPKLTLQPILENTIVHGFADQLSGGLITITGFRTNGQISVTVSDNGCGIDAPTLERLRGRLRGLEVPADEQAGHAGIGLQNVDRRIKLLFGPEYGINLNSMPGIGTDVELFLPCRLSVDDYEA